jgi:dolichol-phosphate mannosyltransferase
LKSHAVKAIIRRLVIWRTAILAEATHPAAIRYYGATAALVDAILFIAAFSAGLSMGPAHIVSFTFAGLLNYVLNLRLAVGGSGRSRDPRLYWHLLAVSLFALFLRGGVLALLTTTWGIPAQCSIVFAILTSMAVMRSGYALSLSSGAWRIGSGMRWRSLAIALIVCAVLLRLVYCGQTELLPEEAYYWNYSRHLDIGYLDHPPMVAWLIRAGTAVFGNSEFGVRIGALGCGVLASFYIYKLTRNLFGEPSALVALVLMQLLPFFFASGFLMTPDAPLTATWAAALYFLERALIAGRTGAWWGAGVSLGAGLLSKYTIGMLVPAVLIFMVIDQDARRWLRHWIPYVASALALALFTPVILWNARHEWISFAFQTAHRLAERPRFSLQNLIASALILLTPPGFVTLPGALRGTGSSDSLSSQDRRGLRFLLVSVLTPLTVYFVFSLRHEVKFDWTGTVWIAAVPALAFGIGSLGDQLARGPRAWGRAAWAPTLVILLLVYGAALHYFVLGLPGVGYADHMELSPAGWRDLGRQVAAIEADAARRTGSAPLVVGMDRYAIASELAFYAPDNVHSVTRTTAGHLFGGSGLMYEQWFPPEKELGRTLVIVTLKPHDVTGPEVESCATRLEPPREGVLMRGGRTVHRFYYRVVLGYRPPAP